MRWIAALVIALAPAVSHAEKVFKKGTGDNWDCAKDSSVRIKIKKGTFGFTGKCKRITVTGAKNVLAVASVGKLVIGGADNLVQVEVVESIDVSGSRNEITWNKAKKGAKPKIARRGHGNRVEKKQ